MHTKHETKDEGIITMVCVSGIFIIGKLTGTKLLDPRIFSIIDDGKRIQMSPLPGTPSFLTLGPAELRYPIPLNANNKNILDLYYAVIHPEEQQGKGMSGQDESNLIKIHNPKLN